jgi:hypothetical protein
LATEGERDRGKEKEMVSEKKEIVRGQVEEGYGRCAKSHLMGYTVISKSSILLSYPHCSPGI